MEQPLVAVEDPNIIAGKVKVPVDREKVAKLTQAFAELSTSKQTWLLTRFPNCDTDVEATKLMENVTEDQVKGWKFSDINFACCYNLLKGGLIDWEQHLARMIEAGNALLGATEHRKLIAIPWDKIESARLASAKSVAINQALDRVIGKRETVDVRIIKIEELLPDVNR